MEDDNKRFGTIAIEKGFITVEQFADAMKVQIIEDMGKADGRRRIGEILMDQGLMSKAQIDEILKTIASLQ